MFYCSGNFIFQSVEPAEEVNMEAETAVTVTTEQPLSAPSPVHDEPGITIFIAIFGFR